MLKLHTHLYGRKLFTFNEQFLGLLGKHTEIWNDKSPLHRFQNEGYKACHTPARWPQNSTAIVTMYNKYITSN